MTSAFIAQAAKVGIVLENGTTGLSGTNITGVGSLYDGTDQTYATVAFKTDVSIETMEMEQETFQDVDDNYDHFVDLRYNGAGSCTIKAIDDTVAANIDAANLLYAGLHLPNGCNNATGDASWNGSIDTYAGTQASDLRGYAIVVEQQVSASVFYVWTFHNCRIKVTPGRSPKQAMTVTLRWEDARTVAFTTAAATYTAHADA